MPAPKPSEDAEWADGPSSPSPVITDPPLGKKQQGWVDNEAPPAEYFNWWMNTIFQWQAYLRDFEGNVHTWTAANTFNALSTFNAPGSSSAAIFNANAAGFSHYAAEFYDGAAGNGAIFVGGSHSNLVNAVSTGAGFAAVAGFTQGAAGIGTSGVAASGAGAGGSGVFAGSQDPNAWGLQISTNQASPVVGAGNLKQQTAPSAPGDGDFWNDKNAHTFNVQLNGKTVHAYPDDAAAGLSFSAGWASNGAFTCRSAKNIAGDVRLQGELVASAGNLATSLFTLPSDQKPTQNTTITCTLLRSGTPNLTNLTIFSATGIVACNIAGGTANGDIILLDGITFPTAF